MSNSCQIIKQPSITPINGREYLLDEDFEVECSGYYFKIFKGFVFDGASIPRAAWSILGVATVGPHLAAACLHDFLYENRGAIPADKCLVKYGENIQDPLLKKFTRENADWFFYQLLKVSCLSKWRCWTMWRAVALFGQKAWDT